MLRSIVFVALVMPSLAFATEANSEIMGSCVRQSSRDVLQVVKDTKVGLKSITQLAHLVRYNFRLCVETTAFNNDNSTDQAVRTVGLNLQSAIDNAFPGAFKKDEAHLLACAYGQAGRSVQTALSERSLNHDQLNSAVFVEQTVTAAFVLCREKKALAKALSTSEATAVVAEGVSLIIKSPSAQ